MLLDEYYRADPELRDAWIALPGAVRAQILQWDARVTTTSAALPVIPIIWIALVRTTQDESVVPGHAIAFVSA